MDTIRERWAGIEAGQRKLILILTATTLITAVVGSFLLRGRAMMSTLYTGLSATETREIANHLATEGIDFKISEDETSIQVPTRLEATARMRLAAAGLPKNAPDKGWEIFGEGGLAVTRSQQTAMQIRALQGELSRSITSLTNVTKAAVHISLKKDSPFIEEEEPAKAAVLISTKPGKTITRDQAMAIAHLVAKSVPDLETAQVTILDDQGNLLFSDNIAMGTNTDENKRQYERDLERRVQSQLDMTFGLGQAIVRATAEVETERAEVRQTTYTPVEGGREGMPDRETIETEEFEGAGGPRVGGVPGTGANLFNENARIGGDGGQAGRYNRSRTERDYLVNTEEQLRVIPGGTIKRVTLGIFVNDEFADQKDAIETVARNAAGIDTARGDSISVEAVKFSGSDVSGFGGMNKLEMVRTIASFILNALALIVGLVTLRSIIHAMKPVPTVPAGFTDNSLEEIDADVHDLLSLPNPDNPAHRANGAPGLSLPDAALNLPDGLSVGGLPMFGEEEVPELMLHPGGTDSTPEELIGRVQSTAVDDIAEVLRHWLHGELDE